MWGWATGAPATANDSEIIIKIGKDSLHYSLSVVTFVS